MCRRLLTTICLLVLSGCSTAPLLQFTSQAPSIRANPGAGGLTPSADSIRIEAQYDRFEGDELLFGIELWNQTSHALDVDPAAFEYDVLLPDGTRLPGGRTIDPDWKLATHDQHTNLVMGLAPKEPGEPSGWQLLGDLLDLLTSGSRTEQEERDRELLRLKQAEETRQARAEHERRLDRLRLERETIVRERMRHTLLPPGQRMTGRVGLPAQPLLSAIRKAEASGQAVAPVGSTFDVPTAGLVLRCRAGDQTRELGFRIRRY